MSSDSIHGALRIWQFTIRISTAFSELSGWPKMMIDFDNSWSFELRLSWRGMGEGIDCDELWIGSFNWFIYSLMAWLSLGFSDWLDGSEYSGTFVQFAMNRKRPISRLIDSILSREPLISLFFLLCFNISSHWRMINYCLLSPIEGSIAWRIRMW
jgi:hypothetical protein